MVGVSKKRPVGGCYTAGQVQSSSGEETPENVGDHIPYRGTCLRLLEYNRVRRALPQAGDTWKDYVDWVEKKLINGLTLTARERFPGLTERAGSLYLPSTPPCRNHKQGQLICRLHLYAEPHSSRMEKAL